MYRFIGPGAMESAAAAQLWHMYHLIYNSIISIGIAFAVSRFAKSRAECAIV